MNSNEKIFSVLCVLCVLEKIVCLQEFFNQYVFEVLNEVIKVDVKVVVEQLFDVKVEVVNVVNVKGKNKFFCNCVGCRGDWCKVYVCLVDGQLIDVMVKV